METVALLVMCNTDETEKPQTTHEPSSTNNSRSTAVHGFHRCCVRVTFQSRPIDDFMEDFEQQEKVFKEEVAQAKERNAQKKASLHCT